MHIPRRNPYSVFEDSTLHIIYYDNNNEVIVLSSYLSISQKNLFWDSFKDNLVAHCFHKQKYQCQ